MQFNLIFVKFKCVYLWNYLNSLALAADLDMIFAYSHSVVYKKNTHTLNFILLPFHKNCDASKQKAEIISTNIRIWTVCGIVCGSVLTVHCSVFYITFDFFYFISTYCRVDWCCFVLTGIARKIGSIKLYKGIKAWN